MSIGSKAGIRTSAAIMAAALLAVGLAACGVSSGSAASPTATVTVSAPTSQAPAANSPATAPTSPAHDTSAGASTPAAESLPEYQPAAVVSKSSTSTVLSSPDSVTKIGAFYADVLAKDGWQVISSSAGAYHASFTAALGHQGVSISVYPRFGGSGISISTYPR
jgi:hypothetical protein